MLQMIFTATEKESYLIVGARMSYAGRTYIKRAIFPFKFHMSDVDREKKIGVGLKEILDQLERPCRIDLRTDLYRMVKNHRIGQHQITWSLVPPTSRIVEDVQIELRQGDTFINIAERILFGEITDPCSTCQGRGEIVEYDNHDRGSGLIAEK